MAMGSGQGVEVTEIGEALAAILAAGIGSFGLG